MTDKLSTSAVLVGVFAFAGAFTLFGTMYPRPALATLGILFALTMTANLAYAAGKKSREEY